MKFNERLRKHRTSFNNIKYKKETKLSELIWSLKERNINFEVKWEMVKRAAKYKSGMGFFPLCNLEKMYILRENSDKMINSRAEVMSKCLHKASFLLNNFEKEHSKSRNNNDKNKENIQKRNEDNEKMLWKEGKRMKVLLSPLKYQNESTVNKYTEKINEENKKKLWKGDKKMRVLLSPLKSENKMIDINTLGLKYNQCTDIDGITQDISLGKNQIQDVNTTQDMQPGKYDMQDGNNNTQDILPRGTQIQDRTSNRKPRGTVVTRTNNLEKETKIRKSNRRVK